MKDGDRQQRSNTFVQTHLMLLLVVLMAALSVGAQTSTTGDIAGVVTDPTAAVVSGAPITLKNVDTGSSTSTTTNAQGSYSFSLLQPGNYSVSANVAGSQKVLKTVTVTLGTSTTVNLQLSLSSQIESVDVTDEVTGVQTEDANLQTNFNAQQIKRDLIVRDSAESMKVMPIRNLLSGQYRGDVATAREQGSDNQMTSLMHLVVGRCV